jgi:Domain of unknown function (DUF5668)
MNCVNHPDAAAIAYCRTCGKPMCSACRRDVRGVIYCEDCIASRLHDAAPPVPPPPAGVVVPEPGARVPSPGLAAVLGFIPGVGAMYNGQYAKAIAHVVIFAVLASLGDHSNIFGILVAAWVFYQVFDAYQTAVARRDGLPLPNPFGLNDIAQRLGIHSHPGMPGVPPMPPVPPVPPPGTGAAWEPVAGSMPPPQGAPYPGAAYQGPGSAGFVPPPGSPGYAPGQQGYGPVPGQPYAPMPPFPPQHGGRDIPTGAIILIGLGILFLFGSLGLLHHDWVSHAWPLLIIGLGIWIIFRRTHNVPPAMPPVEPSSIHSAGHTHSVPTDTTGGTR